MRIHQDKSNKELENTIGFNVIDAHMRSKAALTELLTRIAGVHIVQTRNVVPERTAKHA
jgi:hypothetical protein